MTLTRKFTHSKTQMAATGRALPDASMAILHALAKVMSMTRMILNPSYQMTALAPKREGGATGGMR